MKRIIYFEESPYKEGYFTIRVQYDLLRLRRTEGSFNVIYARLLGVSFGDFLGICRDQYGARVVQKGMYPVPYFKDKEKIGKLVSLLNERANKVMEE